MLGDRIRELRSAHNYNQVQLAQKLSVTKQTISNWENNNIQPSIDMLISLADEFGVSTDYLLERDKRATLDVSQLNASQMAHIHWLIQDMCAYNQLFKNNK